MGRRVTAVILAGGRSSRYGKDKALAVWNGKPFLEWVGRAVAGVSDAFLILAAPGTNGPGYARLVPGATVVPDRVLYGGPVGALRGAEVLIRTRTTLVVPCDAPGLPSGLARRLVATCEETGRPAVAAPTTGPLFTLFAIPTATLRERLPAAQKLQELLGGAEMVPTEAEALNVNEPGA